MSHFPERAAHISARTAQIQEVKRGNLTSDSTPRQGKGLKADVGARVTTCPALRPLNSQPRVTFPAEFPRISRPHLRVNVREQRVRQAEGAAQGGTTGAQPRILLRAQIRGSAPS